MLRTHFKSKTTKMNLNLQYKDTYKKSVATVAAGKTGAFYNRFADINTVEILLDDKPNSENNKKLLDVIKHQFPANITKLTIKSLARKAESLTPYIDALNYSKTKVITEFCIKNLAIDEACLVIILATNSTTHKNNFLSNHVFST